MTVNVTDSPADMLLPFHGKVKVGKRGRYVVWGPAVFWNEAPPDQQAQYFAWINGEVWEVPDPLQTPRWPWHPAEPGEWLTLYREWENADAQQR